MGFFSALALTAWNQDVVHATASPQWLAGGPSHPVRGGPSPCDPLRAWLGPNVHENGRGSLQHRWKGLIYVWYSQRYLTPRWNSDSVWSLIYNRIPPLYHPLNLVKDEFINLAGNKIRLRHFSGMVQIYTVCQMHVKIHQYFLMLLAFYFWWKQ